MRVVLDANVLVSALISTAGPPREIVGAWVDERFELVASPALLEELRDVLARPRFRAGSASSSRPSSSTGSRRTRSSSPIRPRSPGSRPTPTMTT